MDASRLGPYLMHTACPVALVALVIASHSGFARAQTTALPPPAGTVLHTSVNLVLVDVVVTDQGRAIPDLKQNQFRIFEDGREQSITSFDEHRPVALTAGEASGPASSQAASLPPHTYSNVATYQEGGAANVILLDGLNTPKENREFLRQQMIDYLGTVPPNTYLAVFALTSELRMVQGFSSNISQTAKALQNMKPADLWGHLADQPKNFKPDFKEHLQTRDSDATTDDRPQITLQAALQLARYLSLIPGRKNLIWFAGTFPAAVDPRATFSAAHVSVYPVDARGMMSPTGSRVSYLFDQYDQGGAKENEDFTERIKAEHAAMEELAEQTGGKAYYNTNGLKEAAGRAVENGSSYYTIGYTPNAKKLDGKLRRIKVHVDKVHCELAYRRGYYAVPSDADGESRLTEAIVHGAPPATQILFRARILPSTDPVLSGISLPAASAGEMAGDLKGPVQHTVVDLTVDARGLMFKETPEGAHQARIESTVTAYDADGKRINYVLRGNQLTVNRESYAALMTEGVPVRLALDLPAGECFLRIAVFDLDALKAGSLEVPLTVAAH
jgi:VWFA-related protein